MKRLAMVNSDGKSAPVTDDPEDVVTELVDLRRRVFARTPSRRLLTDLVTLDAAADALAGGADGVFVDSFADYGVDALRSSTDRPVVGAGEASIAEAVASLGTFAVVTVWPTSMGFLYEERLDAVPGARQACRAVHHFSPEDELDLVGTSRSVRARMVRGEGDLVDALAESCVRTRERHGVSGILLGCTCMAPVAPVLAAACDFPVLDPARIGLEAARVAVRHCEPGEVMQPDRVVRAAVDAWVGAPGLSDDGDDCEVCPVPATTDLPAVRSRPDIREEAP